MSGKICNVIYDTLFIETTMFIFNNQKPSHEGLIINAPAQLEL